VALGQLTLIGIVGVLLAIATDSVDVPGDAIVALVVVLAFFLLGYAFYSAMFAVAGALVPRQEEIQNVTTPIQIVLFATYFLSFQAVSEPEGGLAQVLTFIPPTAAIVLPVRVISGGIPAWEIAVGTILLALGAAALLSAAARIYANAVLQTGSRVRLADAWRAS
jgi:ABC-2 type transport system permease protein